MDHLVLFSNINQKKRNKNTNKNHLYIYVHNNHCYKINNDVKKFEQVVWKGEFTRKLIV